MTAARHWLMKQEPGDYSWADLCRDGATAWTGVRNFQARLHLQAMQPDDRVLLYHSGAEKQVVGLARVSRAAYADPTASKDDGGWVCVDIQPLKPLVRPVALATIKADPALQEIGLVRQSRLSVMPLAPAAFLRILSLGAAAP
jgi:predicted RNA-binding protein with PUA-like domain